MYVYIIFLGHGQILAFLLPLKTQQLGGYFLFIYPTAVPSTNLIGSTFKIYLETNTHCYCPWPRNDHLVTFITFFSLKPSLDFCIFFL